ncbi:MAG: DNA polymerase I [Chitinophagaceae bacterium]|nr:MAG: DNA polymerase I [Chitinophagaceae bacterium]
MEKKIFLLDAMALIYRAYYALIRNPRVTSKGRNTNAQFGFTNTLIDLINKEHPTHIAVAFDTHAPTERHHDFEAYKANREDTPEDILSALPDIKAIIKGFNIPVIELDGYEADDIIGTLALEAAAKDYTVYMVTPDKDYGQLVGNKVFIYKPPFQGKKEEIMGEKEICEKWDINHVSQVIDMLGLMGDAVDNIPGIPGVGEKTASKLLKDYQSLEGVIESADKIKGKLGEKIKENKDQAVLSKKLATIITDVPIKFDEEDLIMSDPDKEALAEIFAGLEFRSLGKRVLGDEFSITQASPSSTETQKDLFGNEVTETKKPQAEKSKPVAAEIPFEEVEANIDSSIATIETVPHQYTLTQSDKELNSLIAELLKHQEICFDTETTGTDPLTSEIVGMSFSVKEHQGWYIPMPAGKKEAQLILEKFRIVFENKTILFVGQNIKYDMLIIRQYGLEIKGKLFDTMLAHYLIEPEGRRNMDLLSQQYLNYDPVSITTLIGKKGKGQGSMRDVDLQKIKEYAAEDADITLQLKEKFVPLLKEKEVEKVFNEVENPLIPVLADMEYEGVRIDTEALSDFSGTLEKEITATEKTVYEQAGVKFNLSSPKQLGDVLFEKLKLEESPQKTRTGQYATGEDILQKLSYKHKIINDILNYRELTKLKSTYVDALPSLVNRKTGRVHTTYNQAVAVTGRLSSNNPNLQNIPVRTERGREVRKAFIPRNEDYVIVSADYSQIELRIIAAISGDKHMIEAFKNNQDIHATTAAKVYKVPLDKVTPEMRRNAKSVNFGIIYGVSAFGLAENIGVSRTEARELIETYFSEYPSIKKYMENQIKFAKGHGYVQTLLGRKRWLRDINSSNNVVRGYAERNAINMPIQGTAADMIKLAMIAIYGTFEQKKYRSKMVLQVHDELVFDAYKEELDEIKPLILEKMKSSLHLDVPIDAEIGVGKNWLEAH